MPKRNRILIVDDAEINRSLLADMLCGEYEILEAANGVEAINIINHEKTDLSLVLLDIVMPEMDGFEVLSAMNKADLLNSIPVIIISAETSNTYIEHAYDLGAVEYINRPFDEKTVTRRVKNTIMLYSKQRILEDMVTEQMLEKEKSSQIMVEILSHIVEFRNGESGLHVLHIRMITETLLKRLAKMHPEYNLTADRISLISNASALHDIGKITIPEGILNKPGKLTPEEYETMKAHSAAGAEMLERVSYYRTEELVQIARDICRWHHERYDGRGYPDALKGDEIPIAAQVVALADVYDALTNQRVYKPAFTHQEALRMIMAGECGAFSPALLQCLQESAPYLERELKIRSLGSTSKAELQTAARNLMRNGQASSRTLALLEQERTKYQFFASMSREVQFEYDVHSDLLTISEWGAEQLGLQPVILHPKTDAGLMKVLSAEDYEDIQKRLSEATHEDPIITHEYCLTVNGQERWFKAVLRPLWIDDEDDKRTGTIGKFIDVHEQHLELDTFKRLARQDSLTGLYNREYARTRVSEMLTEGLAKNNHFALLLFDLDYFKNANDSHGHVFGDKVLVTVAGNVRASIRESDVFARIGGDEFMLFMEYKDNVMPIIERVFRSIACIYHDFPVATSMGIALAPEDGTDYDDLFHRADQALYAAKRDGRNRYCLYDNSMSDLLSILSPVESPQPPTDETK